MASRDEMLKFVAEHNREAMASDKRNIELC
jgi:hypothetical protein